MAPPPDYKALAAKFAQKYGVPVAVFLRQIGQESGWNPNAHSGAGADGIAQFIPSTAKAYGVNTRDPVSSLDGAARYDAALLKQYGSVARALSAYNSGRPDAYKDPGFAGGQTYNYVNSILGGTGGGAASSPPPAAAEAPAAPVPAPPVDRRAQLLTALGGGNNLDGFYKQLGGALRAQNQPAAPAPNAAPVASALAAPTGGIAKTALTQIGQPYKWGGQAKLGSPTDCSGLLQASAAANGINIGRTTYEQYKQGAAVPLNQLQPGDAVFFHPGPKGPEHVAIYVGNGKVVEDPHTGAVVSVSKLAGRGPIGARRYG